MVNTLKRCQILLPIPGKAIYDYTINADNAKPGTLVDAPFGHRHMTGLIWRLGPGDAELPVDSIRTAQAHKYYLVWPSDFLHFLDWAANWTCIGPGTLFKMALSGHQHRPPSTSCIVATPNPSPERLSPKQRRALDILKAKKEPITMASLCRDGDFSPAVVRGLMAKHLCRTVDLRRPGPDFDLDSNRPILNEEQDQGLNTLRHYIDAGPEPIILDGITGSGKTVIYLEAIADTLNQGGQALVMVPEIALSQQSLSAFERRFGVVPLAWHSSLKGSDRAHTWHQVQQDKPTVVVGARSALFLPFKRLRLIIVDEEHDQTFKQDDGAIYHGRDLAVVRAYIEKIPILLASATPSLESLHNVEARKYRRVVLRQRFGQTPLPLVKLIDLRRQDQNRSQADRDWISRPLADQIKQTLADKKQVLLFLNRRGYAPVTICRSCGHRLQGEKCGNAFVQHRRQDKLICHHCGYTCNLPRRCPACGNHNSLVAWGPGVERLDKEVARRFKEARRCTVSSDSMSQPAVARRLLQAIVDHDYDIIIGTQLMTKGHHFPHLHLVGVIDADLGLSGGDPRACERTFQMLHQVVGRAGRMDQRGLALLQTFNPENTVMQSLTKNARDAFCQAELQARRHGHWPPYGRLAALIISGLNREKVEQACRQLAACRHNYMPPCVQVLGPAPAPITVIRGRYRWRFLVKSQHRLTPFIAHWVKSVKTQGNTRVAIDIDPVNFL